MDVKELYDRLITWLYLTSQIPLPPATNLDSAVHKIAFEAQWDKGMLRNVSELEVVPQLIGTTAEKPLTEAIQMAKSDNSANLPLIKERLLLVQKFMQENGI